MQRTAPPAEQGLNAGGLACLAGAMVLFGGAWPVTKFALMQGAGPLWFAEGRAFFSGLTAAIVLTFMRRLRLPGRADLPALFAVGLFQLAGFFALTHAAIAWVPAGRTAILANTTTIWIAPLSLLVLHERVPFARWLAAGIGLVGVAALMNPWTIDWSSRTVLIGNALLLGAAGSWSVAIVALRRVPPRISMLELLPWAFGLASIALLPLVLAHPLGHWPLGALACMAAIGFVAAPIGTWCILQATATLPAMVSSIGFLMTPAAGLVLSVIWLGERVDVGLIAGSICILAGVAIAAWPRRAE